MSAATATTEPVAPETLSVALHEAAHGVMGVLVGLGCDGLAVDQERPRGIMFTTAIKPPAADRLDGSPLLLDRAVRELVERNIVTTLAGYVAEECWGVRERGYRPEPQSSEVRKRLIDELEESGVAGRIEEWQAETERPLERRTDSERVQRATTVWTGSHQAAAHFVCWLHAETVALVESPRFVTLLHIVSDALIANGGRLPGSEVERLVAEHDPHNSYRKDTDGT